MALPLAAVTAGALIDPTTFGNEVVTALNAAPRGRLTSATKTAAQSGITTVTDVTGLSVTFTAVAGRRYKISARGLIFSSVGGDILQLQLTDGSNNIKQLAQVSSIANFGMSVEMNYELSGVSGSQTNKVRLVRGVGTGTLTFDCGATYPGSILVEDIGT